MDEPQKPGDHLRRIDQEARDWIVRLSSGSASEVDLEKFKGWCSRSIAHKRAFERERNFWQQLQILEAHPRVSASRLTAKLSTGRRGFLIGTGAVATASVAALALPGVHRLWRTDFSTTVGEMADFSLPDGSVAKLNTDSAIAVDFNQEIRLVELLKGEVEFRVKAAGPTLFRVAALGGNSDAMGTVFSVKALDDVATVTVSEGHVRVSGPAMPTEQTKTIIGNVELANNQQTRYAAGERPQRLTTINPETVLAWRAGRVIFEGMAFASAIAELGRYVEEPILIRPGVDANVPVSAIFSTREALAAIDALARTQNLVVHRIPGVLVLVA